MKKNTALFAFFIASFLIWTTGFVNAQQDVSLRLANIPGDGFFWIFSDPNAVTATSPGGTTVSAGFAQFSTFNQFQSDIVGQWLVSDNAGNTTTFEITEFELNSFPEIEIVSPYYGEQFLTGDFVFIVSSTPVSPTPILESLHDPQEVSFDIAGPFSETVRSARYFLMPEVFVSNVELRLGKNIQTPLLEKISNEDANLSNIVTLSSLTERHLVRIFQNSPTRILGDVNRDGIVDDLDTDPFVDVISFGVYQFEADINGDGSVNFLDIAPFLNLIS